MLAVPSKETPPIVLAVSIELQYQHYQLREITSESGSSYRCEDRYQNQEQQKYSIRAAVVVTFEPPVTENVSFKKSISSEPESPVTVIPEPTASVEVAVIRPFASTVRTGIAVPEPIVPAPGPVSIRSIVGVEPSPVAPVTLMLESLFQKETQHSLQLYHYPEQQSLLGLWC